MRMTNFGIYITVIISIVYVGVCAYFSHRNVEENTDDLLTTIRPPDPMLRRAPVQRDKANAQTSPNHGKRMPSPATIKEPQVDFVYDSGEDLLISDGEDSEYPGPIPLADDVLSGESLAELYAYQAPRRIGGQINQFLQPASREQIASADASLRRLEKVCDAYGLDGALTVDTITEFVSSLTGDEMMALLKLCAVGDEDAITKFRQDRGFYIPGEFKLPFSTAVSDRDNQRHVHYVRDTPTHIDRTLESFPSENAKSALPADFLTEESVQFPLSSSSNHINIEPPIGQILPSSSGFQSSSDGVHADDYGADDDETERHNTEMALESESESEPWYKNQRSQPGRAG